MFMMSKYIKIRMRPTGIGIGGAFSVPASFKLDNVNTPFKNVDVKIDTGCSVSTIPLAKFKAHGLNFDTLKRDDITNNIDYITSYGVETGGKNHKVPKTYDEKMVCEALKFRHDIYDFEINGLPISHSYIYVNYNRKGNILIGMDILKDWDIHIRTIDTGETIFLGCPNEQINDAYLQELEDTFHIASELSTKNIRYN